MYTGFQTRALQEPAHESPGNLDATTFDNEVSASIDCLLEAIPYSNPISKKLRDREISFSPMRESDIAESNLRYTAFYDTAFEKIEVNPAHSGRIPQLAAAILHLTARRLDPEFLQWVHAVVRNRSCGQSLVLPRDVLMAELDIEKRAVCQELEIGAKLHEPPSDESSQVQPFGLQKDLVLHDAELRLRYLELKRHTRTCADFSSEILRSLGIDQQSKESLLEERRQAYRKKMYHPEFHKGQVDLPLALSETHEFSRESANLMLYMFHLSRFSNEHSFPTDQSALSLSEVYSSCIDDTRSLASMAPSMDEEKLSKINAWLLMLQRGQKLAREIADFERS